MLKLLKAYFFKAIERTGYKLVKADKTIKTTAPELASLIKGKTMLTTKAQLNVVEMTEYIVTNSIPGDFVECGVWKGGSVALMAYTLKRIGSFRNLHLFDAFDDICQPDAKVDGERAIREVGGADFAQGALQPLTGIYKLRGGPGNDEEVLDLLKNRVGYPEDKIHLYKGWFQNTLPTYAAQINKIALLRLDGDWYASTKVCLAHLYDQVEIGGVVIIDDYYTYDGCSKAVNEFWDVKGIRPYTIKVSNDCLFWIKTDK